MLASLSSSLLRRRAPCAPLVSCVRGLAAAVPKHRQYPQWSSPKPKHDAWLPNSWYGAYYKMREHDPAAMRNRERLMGRRTPSTGRFICTALEQIEVDKLKAKEPWRVSTLKPGDFLQVEHIPKVGETPQIIVGVMIGMVKRGLGSSFRLLCNLDSVAVEYQFMLYSPLVVNILVRKPSEWRNKQRKLFKLRPQYKLLSYPPPIVDGKVVEGKKKGKGGAGKKR